MFAAQAHAQSCKPDFGERMLHWAEHDAASDSRALAKADYELRVLNYMLLALDAANAKMLQVTEDLDTAAASLRAAEAATDPGPVLAAVARERHAATLQGELFRIKTTLEDVDRLHATLRADPELNRFYSEGLHNVGRATLLASFTELGDAAQASLASRYGVVVSLNYSESSGEYSGSVEQTPGGVGLPDVAASLAVHYGGAQFGPIIAFAYFEARTAYEENKCRKRIKQQQEMFARALEMIPQAVIQPDEQFELYRRIYTARRAEFAQASATLLGAEVAARARWRELFAANAQRAAAARSVLTAAKVEDLRRRFGSDDRVTRLFDAMGRAEMLSAVNRLHAWTVEGQTRLLLACGDVAGFSALEDQLDALEYARESYAAIAREAGFVPLRDVLERRAASAEDAEDEAETVGRRLRDTACLPQQQHLARHLASRSRTPSIDVSSVSPPGMAIAAQRMVLSTAGDGGGFCVLWRTGGGLAGCRGTSGGSWDGGAAYSGSFSGASDDPRTAVLGRAFDGGFRDDKRNPSVKIQAAVNNIRERTRALDTGLAEVTSAMPEWHATNSGAMAQLVGRHADARVRETSERENFARVHAASVEAANAYVTAFLARPAHVGDATRLLRDIDATDLALPALPPATVPANAPPLPGITAIERVHGDNSHPRARAIERERLRAMRDIDDPALRALSDRAMQAARAFSDTAGGDRVVEELIGDSAAARQLATGMRNTLDLATVDDEGRWGRVVVTDLEHLPAQAVLSRVKTFERDRALYDAESEGVRSTFGAGDRSAAQRRAVVDGADRMAAQAQAQFYAGDLQGGSDLLRYATATLDLALSLAPGIGWGRDIYEAIYGEDLLSGESLDTVGRVGAVIGAITGGFGDDLLDVGRVLRKLELGESFGRTTRILDANRQLRAENIQYSVHARQQQLERAIPQDRVDNAIASGSRWWDVEEETIVFWEAGVPAGHSRVGLALDPFTHRVTTVMKRTQTDEKIASTTRNGKLRFRRLPGGGPSPPL